MLQRNKPAWIAGAALLCVVLLGILVVTQRSGNDAATQTQATPLGEGDGRVLGMATPVLATATPAPPTPRTAVVRGVGTDALRVRQAPSLTGEVVFSVGDETEVTVIEGPVQADGYEWWQIEFDGVRGWCVGEYLEIAGG